MMKRKKRLLKVAKKHKKEKAFMHKKDLGIPRRQNGIPVKKKKQKQNWANTKNKREKNTCLGKTTRSSTDKNGERNRK